MKRTKNSKVNKKALNLGKETVRSLTEDKLDVVDGGQYRPTCYSDKEVSCCAME
jgi:hypothetical protein